MKKFETTFSPRFIPNDQSIIYHYCNDDVLKSICENQEIWLSDIYAMNDSSEFEWGRELFITVLKENKKEFDQLFRFFIVSKVMSAVPDTLPLIGCFSKNGDLLSQWRAYSEDGKGFSIGFDSNKIYQGLGVHINSVVYEEEVQYKLILNTLRGLHAIWKSTNENYDEIQIPSQIFSIDLAYLKNPTFFEEQEIRIIRLLVKDGSEYVDVGGNSEINDVYPLKVSRRKRDEGDIMYIKLPLKIKSKHIIKEIIIGPKNENSVKQMEDIIRQLGLDGVSVKKSKSTYR
ncbi:MAG: DUF2971 domain-containing protein [Ginsengibacter sp.]